MKRKTRQIIRYQATATLRRPQIKQYTTSTITLAAWLLKYNQASKSNAYFLYLFDFSDGQNNNDMAKIEFEQRSIK